GRRVLRARAARRGRCRRPRLLSAQPAGEARGQAQPAVRRPPRDLAGVRAARRAAVSFFSRPCQGWQPMKVLAVLAAACALAAPAAAKTIRITISQAVALKADKA